MELPRKFTYEEMCKQLNRNELIFIDTNAWLELYYFSIDDIEEIINSLNKECFIHELYVTPHIYEEYKNGVKKIKNTFVSVFERNRSQIIEIYKRMNDRINEIDKSFNNYVGFGTIVKDTKKFYNKICKKIDTIQFHDSSNFEEKEKKINGLIDYCLDNYNKIPKVNSVKAFEKNVWKSDLKKEKNNKGDLIIWNEILDMVVNIKASDLILIEEEKKKEWDNVELLNSLTVNSSVSFHLVNLKKFISKNLKSISSDLYCKCFNHFDRFYQFSSISEYHELSKMYRKLMKSFNVISQEEFWSDLKGQLIEDIKILNLANNIELKECIILNNEALNKRTPVDTSFYDEVRLTHLFRQKVECKIRILFRNKIFDIPLENLFVKYALVSDRLFANDDISNSKEKIDEWINVNVSYDYNDLKEKLISLIK